MTTKTLKDIIKNYKNGKSYLEWAKDQKKNKVKGQEMSDIEFIDYIPVDDDPYLQGVATIRDGKRILRYRIVPKKDGSGWFPAPPSIRIKESDGSYQYLNGFESDSKMEDQEIMTIIREGVSLSLSSGQQQQTQESSQENFAHDLDSCPF